MACKNCGSPLPPDSRVCAFCGTHNDTDVAQKAEVPAELQKGEGARPDKTHEDSLREIARSVEHAGAVHSAELGRNRWVVRLVIGGVVVVGLALIVWVIGNSRWENSLNGATMQVQKYEFGMARIMLEEAASSRPSAAEPHFLMGASYYVEFLRKGDAELLESGREHLQDALRRDPELVPAHFYMGMYYVAKGMPEKAREEFSQCEDGPSKYRVAARSMQTALETLPLEEIELHSEVDNSLLNNPAGAKLKGIEVPFP